MLSHRLGLIPLTGNTRGLDETDFFLQPDPENDVVGSTAADYNTVILRLDVTCSYNESAGADETEPTKRFHNSNVYAREITFHPVGRQVERFATGPIHAVNPELLIAKLRPGQTIDVEMHCVKGIGMDHSKFSPVATATYRLMPKIEILRPIIGNDARKFRKCFRTGVVGINKVSAADARIQGSGYEGHEGEEKAVVLNPFEDTVSRECLRHDEFKDKVKLGRVQDHFIFAVESTGQFESTDLVLRSLKILRIKAIRLRQALTLVEKAGN